MDCALTGSCNSARQRTGIRQFMHLPLVASAKSLRILFPQWRSWQEVLGYPDFSGRLAGREGDRPPIRIHSELEHLHTGGVYFLRLAAVYRNQPEFTGVLSR